jgi:hypothetical protein
VTLWYSVMRLPLHFISGYVLSKKAQTDRCSVLKNTFGRLIVELNSEMRTFCHEELFN